jgi:hypothetical protein
VPLVQGPCIFHDDDTDKWFIGFIQCTIYGIELNHSKRLTYIDSQELIALDPVNRLGASDATTTIPSSPSPKAPG